MISLVLLFYGKSIHEGDATTRSKPRPLCFWLTKTVEVREVINAKNGIVKLVHTTASVVLARRIPPLPSSYQRQTPRQSVGLGTDGGKGPSNGRVGDLYGAKENKGEGGIKVVRGNREEEEGGSGSGKGKGKGRERSEKGQMKGQVI